MIFRRLSAALALAIVLCAPTFVEAQQMFPNAPIRVRRQRPPCATEPPYYKYVRQQYYGYFPTCWRKWPTGWQCPCGHPDPPDLERSLRERPLEATKPSSSGDSSGGLDDTNPRPLELNNPKNELPDDEMTPKNPPPLDRNAPPEPRPENPGGGNLRGRGLRGGVPGSIPGDAGPNSGGGLPAEVMPGGRNEPRSSNDDPAATATVAAADTPSLPPVNLANDEAAPGSIDPVPSPLAAEAEAQPQPAPVPNANPARPVAQPARRRGFLSAFIARVRRG